MGFHVVYTSFVHLSSATARYFSFPKRPGQLWDPHSSCSMSARVLYRRQCGRRVNLTTQLRLAPWLKMSGTTPLLSLYAFIVWTWTTLRKTDHYIFPSGVGHLAVSTCGYGWGRGKEGVLPDCYWYEQHTCLIVRADWKHQAFLLRISSERTERILLGSVVATRHSPRNLAHAHS
jgi:hypothetical protein